MNTDEKESVVERTGRGAFWEREEHSGRGNHSANALTWEGASCLVERGPGGSRGREDKVL